MPMINSQPQANLMQTLVFNSASVQTDSSDYADNDNDEDISKQVAISAAFAMQVKGSRKSVLMLPVKSNTVPLVSQFPPSALATKKSSASNAVKEEDEQVLEENINERIIMEDQGVAQQNI